MKCTGSLREYVTPNVKEGLAHCLKCTDQDHLQMFQILILEEEIV
jgi:hypothetical protein